MTSAGFEHAIPAIDHLLTYALDRTPPGSAAFHIENINFTG
jgi:hypothetical protein